MTGIEQAITIAAVVAGTMVTRFLPFIAFPDKKTPPAFVTYLGKVLPGAAMALLVIYALRNVDVLSGFHGLPEAIAMLAVVGVHVKWRNMLISIAVGTFLYMALIRFVFV